GDFPDPRMVEGELLGDAVADAVSPAIADVADPGPFGAKDQGRGGRAEPAELRVLLADRVDAGVGFLEGPAQGREDPFVNVLQEEEGNVADGLGTGFFADGVAAHAIGDD